MLRDRVSLAVPAEHEFAVAASLLRPAGDGLGRLLGPGLGVAGASIGVRSSTFPAPRGRSMDRPTRAVSEVRWHAWGLLLLRGASRDRDAGERWSAGWVGGDGAMRLNAAWMLRMR